MRWEGFYWAGAITKSGRRLPGNAALLCRQNLEVCWYRYLRVCERLILGHELLLNQLRLLRQILVMRRMVNCRILIIVVVRLATLRLLTILPLQFLHIGSATGLELSYHLLILLDSRGGWILRTVINSFAFDIKLETMLAFNAVGLY